MLIPHVLLSSKEANIVIWCCCELLSKKAHIYLSSTYSSISYFFQGKKILENCMKPYLLPFHRTATATASHHHFNHHDFSLFYKVVFCIVLRFGVCIHTFIAFYNDAFLFSQKNISNTTTTTSCWLNSFSFSSSSSSHPITIILNKRNTTQCAIWCIWSESEMRTLVKKRKNICECIIICILWTYTYIFIFCLLILKRKKC